METNLENLPLISVIVVTYNSALTVLETLDSIKQQTYKNIELIITDDYSKDNTIETCINWLNLNKGRFVNTTILKVEKNTGVAANCNRGLKASAGLWIKFIAGDDILLPNCLNDNQQFSTANNSGITFSRMNFFKDGTILKKDVCGVELKRFIRKSSLQSKRKSYIRNCIFLNVPTIFFSKEVLIKLNGFDERFRLLEDQPLILKALNNSYSILFLDKTTINYRIFGNSITASGKLDFINELYRCYKTYRRPNLNSFNLIDLIFKMYLDVDFYFKLKGFNRKKWYRLFNKITIIIRYIS
jgi:glycosyltransferase involved in cell wall biosynthesis